MTNIKVEFESIEEFTGNFIATLMKLEPRDDEALKALTDDIVAAVAKYLGWGIKE